MKYLHEIYNAVRTVLTFIGVGTVLAFIGWLYKRRQENFEDKVLLMFERDPHQQWRTAQGIHSDYGRENLKDVPTWVVLRPPNITKGWPRWKWRFRTIPYQVRHFWRVSFFMPSSNKVEKTMLHLWKRGLLIREPTKSKYYKLKS
jgi:hypothetical protein